MGSMFCPMCVSGGRKRKGHSYDDSGGSDNDDDNFYRPSKEALKSKTSSISTSDPEQPFHVPSIFKPIRVDSPALFVHGSSSTVSDSRVRGEHGDIIFEDDNSSSNGTRAHGSNDDESSRTGNVDDGANICSHLSTQSKQVDREGGVDEKHSEKLNKSDDISKPVEASPSKKVECSSSAHGSIVNIVRARPRPGSDFRKKTEKKDGLPTTYVVEEEDAILNPDNDHRQHFDTKTTHDSAQSLSSQSSRSLSVNDSPCPDPEARQPLLLAGSELDLVSDEDDKEFEPIQTTPRENSPCGIEQTKDKHEEKKVSENIPQIVTDSLPTMEQKFGLRYSSGNSSKSSTPAPPPLPDCLPPDSENECWSRSGSNTRSPSRCRYHLPYRGRAPSCSCCTSPCRDNQRPDVVGGYTLNIMDVAQIHYADSASSCCGSDIGGDVGEGEVTVGTDGATPIAGTSSSIQKSTAPTSTKQQDSQCPCHHVDEISNKNCQNAGHDLNSPLMTQHHQQTGYVDNDQESLSTFSPPYKHPIRKVSASVNTDIVMPYEDEFTNPDQMGLDTIEDSPEELRSASTTPTPPVHELFYSPQEPTSSSTLNARGIKSSSVTITLKTPQTENPVLSEIRKGEKMYAESDPILWGSGASALERRNKHSDEITYFGNSAQGSIPMMAPADIVNDDNQETRVLQEGFYYSELDLELALRNKHIQASDKWHYPYNSTGHVATEDPKIPLVPHQHGDSIQFFEGEPDEEMDEDITLEDLKAAITLEDEADQSPQANYRIKTNVTGSWFSLSSSSSFEELDDNELGTYGSGGDSGSSAIAFAAAAITSSFDPEKWTPESSPSLSVLSYEEILNEQQKIQEDVKKVVDSVKLNFGEKTHNADGYALDLASQSNVQDAFVIAVEQQARERLEKLSALKKIKPVDMTKLSHQLSEAPSESGETSAELNGLIEAATGSPIYVTSASELNSSQSALHRTAASSAAPGEESQEGKSPSRSTPTSTVTTKAVISRGPDVSSSSSPSKAPGLVGHVTVVGVNSGSGSTIGGTCLPNGQYSSGGTTTAGDRSTESSLGEPVLPAKKSISKESVKESRKSGSRESIADSVQLEGAKPSPSRSRGSASKLTSLSSSRESVIEASSSSQYANMINMVEWDNGPHREMAVDVPESFVPRNKTPPRYPPTNKSTTLNSNNNKTAGKSVVSDGVGGRGNGTASSGGGGGHPGQNGAAGKPVPPPRIGDKEGVYSVNNNQVTQVPHVTPRTVGQAKTAVTTPSRDEAERIRKYQEELKKRREQEEQHAKEEEFLRNSLRGSKKLQALESVREDKAFPTGEPKGFVNHAYDLDGDRISHPLEITLEKPVALPELVASLQRVQQALKKHGVQLDEAVSAVGSLMQTPEFQQVLAVHNKVQDVWCFNAPPTPVTAHAQQLNQECLESLYNCSSPASAELVELLSRVDMDGVMHAHDKIAERERLLMTAESPLNAGESVDPLPIPVSATSTATAAPTPAAPPAPVVGGTLVKSVARPAFVPEPQPDDHIKVVRIEKTQDPLGATVRNDGEAVVIGRIVKGGAAERSGLLHEGDEILEVNGVEMRGKSVNEVCDILSRMTGTLTFLIVPTQIPVPIQQQRRDILVHVRAHFDYDPEDDIYIPCRELGVAFAKGDVLHVINQEDPNWWQAHREGEEDQQLAGLIPSKSFQEQREAVKQTLLGETESREKSKKGTLLCAKTHKKKKKKIPYSSAFNDEFDAEEIPTYEEVALYYPRTSFKRPVVLIGPPNIGRHELRQRLMQESDRFAAAVPHTSRSRKDGEIDGQDYHFISRAQFESDILSRKFVEHGEFEKAYYGTSLDAIRSVVNAGKICVLNLHPQSLKILRTSDLKPYIVFIAPPPLERLKQMRIARGEAYKEDELIDIIEKAREMEEKYGHYFDLVIVNNDIERTYHELVQRINYIEREPQWVPAFWLKQ